MTARDYVPKPGDVLKKNTLYYNSFPSQITIIKITRSGHIHYERSNEQGTWQSSMTLSTLRKCFALHSSAEPET